MKKINSILMVILFAVLLVNTGCKKDFDTNNDFFYRVTSKIPYSEIKVINKNFKGIQGSENMLYFPDMETFKYVLDDLRKQMLEYDSVFMEKYKNYTLEEINKIIEEIGYNEEQPLYDFAKYYNFYNLHQKIAELEIIFLQNDELDINNDPDNNFIIEKELRTLLNTDCEVKINDTIYKLTETGYYAICDGNLKSLQIIDNNLNNHNISIKNVLYVGESNDSKAIGCNSNKYCSGYENNERANYKIKWVVSHWTHPWERRVIAKIDNYKKKNHGWTKEKAYSYCKVYGYVSGIDINGNAECDVQYNFNPYNSFSHNYGVKSWEHKIKVPTKTKSDWVKAKFIGIDGISCVETLIW
ncbi:MAG TPA: hypothetical protein PKY44_09525 [Bacteroidales bacterium]|nr:hypothetical protein [Bacteroidales bacterium]